MEPTISVPVGSSVDDLPVSGSTLTLLTTGQTSYTFYRIPYQGGTLGLSKKTADFCRFTASYTVGSDNTARRYCYVWYLAKDITDRFGASQLQSMSFSL